jgi:hypothetical protein
MKRLLTACALACMASVAAHAQDTTVKSRTKVSGDDAKAVTMTGCLERDATGAFMLSGVTAAAGEDLKSKAKTTTDVDSDDVTVRNKSTTKVDGDTVGTSGVASSYVVSARDGVDLSSHVNHRVEVSAVALDATSGGDKEADVKIKEDTKVKADDAPDAKVESKTKAELPRGPMPRLTALSIKTLSATCN